MAKRIREVGSGAPQPVSTVSDHRLSAGRPTAPAIWIMKPSKCWAKAAPESGEASRLPTELMKLDQRRFVPPPGPSWCEWDRKSHRVMVMPDGFAWNGKTFDSLSKVALAITGTKWNGPRFFGLRDRPPAINAGEAQ